MTEMSPIEQLFYAALEKVTPAERAAYLDQACAGQPDLRNRVEKLLAAHPQVGDFLEQGMGPASVTAAYSEDQHSLIGTLVAGKYKLLEEIGEGGMGTVFVAEQTEPVKRKVAVKLIKPGMDSKNVLARFEAERQALAMMDHPNIARVLDAGLTEERRPFFVMEYIKGLPLTKYCDDAKLSINDRLQLFIQICQAVQHAHQKGIIHRDLKPGNILIALYDGKPVPKVIDFGLAKALHQSLTERTLHTGHEMVLGTPLYMSPEQAELNNLDIDTRSDIYSLGVILYELLTGVTPLEKQRFKQAAWAEVLRIIKEEEPSKPSTKLSHSESLPSVAAQRQMEPKKLSALMKGDLDWIAMKALEKDRSRRYETANGFAADVLRYLSGEAVTAVPPSTGYRFKKFVKRNQGKVVAAGLMLGLLLAGIVGTTFGLLQAREAKERETARADGEEKAKLKAVEAEATAVAEKKKAIEFRDKALDALRATTGDDVEKLLGEKKELTANEKAYLEAIAQRWQTFAKQEGTDEQSRAIGAEGHDRVGHLWQKLGRREEARPKYEQAVALREKLAADFPAVPYYRSSLAASHYNLGYLLAGLGKGVEAEEQSRKSMTIQEKLAADFPAVPDYRHELALSHNNLGLLQAELGKRVEAEQQYKKGLSIQMILAADFPTVPDYRRDLAKSHFNLGNLLAELGKQAEAEEQQRMGLALREKLAADFPAVPDYRSHLTGSHTNLGILLYGLGKRVEAEEQFRKGLALQEKLAADFPAVPDYRSRLANSHNNLGRLLDGLGKRAEAEVQQRKGLAIQEKLAADFPTVPEYRSSLALSHNNLGVLLYGLGKQAEAEEQYRKGLAIREKLVADFPAVPDYQVQLGNSYSNLGSLVFNSGKPANSLAWFDKSIITLQPVHEAEPQAVIAKRFLKNGLAGRAIAYDALGKHAEALKDWDKVVELSPPQEQPAYRASRAASRLQAGMVAEALAEVAELTKSLNWIANQWYNFACAYAVASGKIVDKKTENADRAMELLAKAVQAGYKDAAHMKKDTDLDALRQRDDFKKLLGELEKKPTLPQGDKK